MKRFVIQSAGLLVVFLLLVNFNTLSLNTLSEFDPAEPRYPDFLKSDSIWVDSVLNSLSLDQKIGQLFMIPAYSYMGEDHIKNVSELIKKYQVGGIIFMKGSPVNQVKMTNYFQSLSGLPLMIATDAEWGLDMRLDSTIRYPWQMMMGAIQDESLVYQMGYDIGKQLVRMGVHVNFAPVVDINNNPLNPVINSRSFGEERNNVASKALMYARGLEDAGVMAVYKHFPGHGDTDSDSHYKLPVISHDRSRLDSIELYPFKKGINSGIPAIMAAHLFVPALDSTPDLPSSLSYEIITHELIEKLDFKGLIFTDALGMGGVSNNYKPGEIEIEAFEAGNDILLMPDDVSKAFSMIKREIKRGRIPEKYLDDKCRKILQAKYWLGLTEFETIPEDSLIEDLNDPFYKVEKEKFIANAITLVKNNKNIIPVKNIENYNIASISLSVDSANVFSNSLKLYTDFDDYPVTKTSLSVLKDSLFTIIKSYNTVILSIHGTSQWPSRKYGNTPEINNFLEEIDYNGNLILCYFGNPYGLQALPELEKFDAIVLAYEDTNEAKRITAQAVFGAIAFKGKLPVTVNEEFRVSTGIETASLSRLTYGIPESVSMSSAKLEAIDTIVFEAISKKATPGCQILIARSGKVIFNRSYGYQTYQNRIPVTNDQIYDLASVTKIVATLPALMKLQDEKRFSVFNKLGDYLLFPDTCNKKDLVIGEVLTHQSGLAAWIPFYYKTLEPLDTSEQLISNRFSFEYPFKLGPGAYLNRNIVYKDSVYSTSYSPMFPVQVAENLYIRDGYRDSIYMSIMNSELQEKTYRYSDLGYYLFQEIIENETGTPLQQYVYNNFYRKIGAYTTGYLPLKSFDRMQIVPTENDVLYRKQLLRGYVHDPGAAMLGGVAGHAGLFSNANDLAKFMQMFLNSGYYGGTKFLSDSVITQYTSRVFHDNGNRRAYGFDKPEPDTEKIGPTCPSASLNSYGHTGFTGTMVWIDPDYDLIYIFLSNRIHPNQFNTTLIAENFRTRIQQAMYDAILK